MVEQVDTLNSKFNDESHVGSSPTNRTCGRCGETKSEDEFSWRIKNVRRSTVCKSCHKSYAAIHYMNNKADYLGRARSNNPRYIKRNVDYVTEYLAAHPCVDCGFSDTRALDFDHVRGTKLFNIGQEKWMGNSLRSLLEEIDKCEVRCANCHRIVTAERKTVTKMPRW